VQLALALALIALAACSGRTASDGEGGSNPGGTGGAGNGGVGAGGFGGSPCLTPEGVRICGGANDECAWVGPDACPAGGCARPYDRTLGGDAAGGVCFSDLADNASRACWGCEDGEVCVERELGELVCVPESVCAALWQIGVRGVCRYADLSSYDGRELFRLSTCPDSSSASAMCGGPCANDCEAFLHQPCSGRSPDHPQGFCFGTLALCSLGAAGYTQPCEGVLADYYCGVYQVSDADAPVARHYGQCLTEDACLRLAAKLPGGFLCYDSDASLVNPP
jgi:hypothetical protein